MLGNVFSPYYAKQRIKGPTDPLGFCTVNVAYYGRQGTHWALTERGSSSVDRSAGNLSIGASTMSVQGDGTLRLRLDERTTPLGRALRGSVHVRPTLWNHGTFRLDASGAHHWSPLALNAEASVDLELPRKERWSGRAYVDTNFGDEPLERGFRKWDWSRSSGPDATHVLYDIVRRDGTSVSLRETFFPDGRREPLRNIGARTLPSNRWGVERTVPTDGGGVARELRSLEDTPFYARTLAEGLIRGETTHIMHETVDLDRFKRGWVQFLVPFRMRRAA